MKVLVTGGAGFIGSAVCRLFVGELGATVLNVDKLTYAANLALAEADREQPALSLSPRRYLRPHADRGAAALLRARCGAASRRGIACRPLDRRPRRVHQDQYRGHLRAAGGGARLLARLAAGAGRAVPLSSCLDRRGVRLARTRAANSPKTSRYQPNSPYAASKAASDHLVRAWHETFGLPTVLSNCSNNYGPYHFPEKLIPLAILKALHGEPIPVYGKGDNVRDWLYVEDHARALHAVLTRGRPGESYNVGGDGERTNLDVVTAICALLDEMLPNSPHRPHERPDHLCRRPARPRPALCDGRAKIRTRTRLAAARDASRAGCARRSPGISTTAGGGSRSGPSATAARGSASLVAQRQPQRGASQ